MKIEHFKIIPSEQTKPYKDRFRIHHDRNLQAVRKEKKIEKRFELKDAIQKRMQEIHEEKLVQKENNERWRRLNIIS